MSMKNQVEYYRHPSIRERLAQYCGGRFGDLSTFTCEHLVGSGETLKWEGYSFPIMVVDNRDMARLLEKGLDLFRAVWDKKSTLAILDIEYFNLDSLAGLYTDQLGSFRKMEPIYSTIERVLEEYHIPHVNNTTTSGYHFVSRIPFTSPVHRELEEIGYLNPTLKEKYRTPVPSDIKRQRPVPLKAGKAYSAIGRLMEFLCHRFIIESKKSSPLPVTISDIAPGANHHPREGISLDLTQYGDSLFMRTIRLSFSAHQKHKINPHRAGKEVSEATPVYMVVPRNRLSYRKVFEIRRDYKKAIEYAKEVSTVIPDASRGWGRVLEDYKDSKLYKFHQEFDRKRYLKDYDKRIDWESLPPCLRHILQSPCPALLVPTNILHFCRAFLCLGWHPKHIAGLIHSYYQKDYGWMIDWEKYDSVTRADFWARVYCGMIQTGVDDLEDFTCRHHQRRGFCPSPIGAKLASRPFGRGSPLAAGGWRLAAGGQPDCGYSLEALASRLKR